MLISQGIRIYLEDPATAPDNPALGITAGVATLLEGTGSIPPAVTYYRNDLFPKKWNSGFSDKFDFRTHVRPQIIGDCTVTISNVNNYYSDLQNAGYELEGKRVEFVFYTDDVVGSYSPASPYFVKSAPATATVIQLKLAGIDSQQHIDISKPITGDTWEPVIIGDHEKGVYVSTGIVREAPDEKNWRFISYNRIVTRETPNYTNRVKTVNYSDIQKAEDRTSAPSDYVNSDSGNYYTVDTGGGQASYEISGITAQSETTAPQFVTFPAKDIDDNYEIKNITEESGITENVSAGNIEKISLTYTTDNNASSTSNTIYNKEGEELPNGVLVFDGSSIKLGSGVIKDNSMSGYNSIALDSVESVSAGFTKDPSNPAVIVINTHGDGEQAIIDGDKNTYYGVDYNTINSIPVLGVSTITYDFQALIKGNFDKASSTLWDLQVFMEGNYGSTEIFNPSMDRTVRIKVTCEYIWQPTSNWGVISNPIEVVNKEVSYSNLFGSSTVFRITPPSYYQGENSYTYVNDNYDDIGTDTEIEAYPYGIFVTGIGQTSISTNYGPKAPDGLLYKVTIEDNLRNDFVSGGVTPEYQISLRAHSLGAISDIISTSFQDGVYSGVSGRPYTTFKLYQEHISKLLNWSLNHKTKPEIGWGLAECTDANVNTFDTSTEAIRSQWINPSELNTKKQIEILCRESWNPMVSKNDAKSWYSFLDKIGAESPVRSYVAPSDCRIVSAVPFDEQDIYNVYTVEYDYDIVTNTYLKSISITKPSQDDYSAEYVSGITDTAVASSIWNKCKVLYEVAGSEKKLPDNLSKLRHVYTEEVAIQHILNYIEFFGVNGSSVYNPNYLVVADHPVEHLFVSAPMNTIGYTSKGLWSGVEATGIITGRKYNAGEPKRVQITSIVKPTFILGRIIEQDGNVDRIIEDDSNPNRIVEV